MGFDICSDALEICAQNIKDYEIPNFDLAQVDVSSLDTECGPLHKVFDTVIMNPPFGTKNEGE